jgi:Histidine kinase-, DNA gyrase B-, and HSP90-like ATPase
MSHAATHKDDASSLILKGPNGSRLAPVQIGRRSNEEELEPLRFKVKGRLAHLLGADSVSDIFVAINELVKNSYDADATKVRIKFENVRGGSPAITITDDGHGMTFYDLENEWMTIGTDRKLRDPYTTKYKRRKIGHKGIGRFAVQNLARMVEVVSYPEGESKGYRIVFDWDSYNQSSAMMEGIPNPTFSFPKKKDERGLEIRLANLRHLWGEETIKGLSRDLGMIIPPNLTGAKFNTFIDAAEFPRYSGKIRSTLFKQAVFTFRGKLSATGKIRYVLESRKGERHAYEESLKEFACGPVEFVMFFYYRDRDKLAEYGVTVADIDGFRETLDEFGGVKLYRDNIRVTGIGDPGEDWLQLDAMRVNAPALIPSTNQIVGMVRIGAETNPGIVDTTTREGIIGGKAYTDLRDFVRASIKFFADHRAELEGKRKKGKRRKKGEVQKTLKNLASPQEPPKFLDFRPRYPEVFYRPLEEEINQAHNSNLPNATLMLARKLIENLLYNLLERKFPDRIILWYEINQGRANDFSVLILGLQNNKKKFSPDEQELIEKLLALIKPFRREANSKTHKVIQYLDVVGDLNILKIPEIVELELKLIEKVRGLAAPVATK